MSITAREIHLKSRPVGLPAAENFALVERRLEAPAPGQLLVRNTWISVDPYMRGRMVDRQTYIPPFKFDEVMDGAAVGVVEASHHPDYVEGDVVVHFAGWRDHAVIDAAGATKIVDHDIAPQLFLSSLGFPGLTAYAGLLRLADIKEGETLFVSAASGAVGLVVSQIAKIKGLKVVSSTGSSDKADWLLNEVGVDAVVNYREVSDLTAAVAAAAPEGIDVYYDNVGGDHLEAAIAVANDYARIVLCGMISGYNDEGMSGPANIYQAVEKRLKLQGLIGADHFDLLGDFTQDMSGWVRQGLVTMRETVVSGLENAPDAFIGLFKGANTGKMLVKV